MISRNDLENWESNDYLDKVILHSIAILNSLSLGSAKELDLIAKKYSSELLSEVSYMITYIDFVLDNLSTIQQNMYLPEIIDNNANVRNITFNALSMSSLQLLTNQMTVVLNDLKGKIEVAYNLPSNSLSIYTDTNIEQGINFVEAKATSPIALKYYEGKVFLRKTISLFEDFSVTKNYYDEADISGEYSFSDKLNTILSTNSTIMQKKLSMNEVTEEIIDSCLVLIDTYLQYNFSSRESIDLFLNRKYSKIKEDIILALENYL